MSDEKHVHKVKAVPVDRETAEFCQEMAHQLAIDLGESSEAWRGAAVMAFFIKSCCSAETAAMEEIDLVDFEPSDLVVHQLLTIAILEQFPTWPKDDSGGPKLMVDTDEL